MNEEEAVVLIQKTWKGYIARESVKSQKRQIQKRSHAAKEILSTEQHYCGVLDMIVSKYVIPLRETGLLTKKNLGLIFSNVEDIRIINNELREAMEARMENWTNSTRVGDVFAKLVPFLKLYKTYCANYNGALTRLEQKRESNSKFSAFLERTREEIGKNMPLPSLLIQPVQRIPRYRLLFAELLKMTPEDHIDYDAIQQALHSIEEIAIIVNESIREAEYLNQLIEIKKKFSGGLPNLVVPRRYLVREGPLMKVCRKETKQRMFFLFNDLLIYAVTIENPTAAGQLRFHRALSLNYTTVVDAPDRPNAKYAFQVLSKEKSFTVLATSQEEKLSWLDDIAKTKDGSAASSEDTPAIAMQAATTSKGNEHAPAPVWVPDKDRKNCMICDMKFTTLKRRHHCRRCGTLCCGACSAQKAFLPNLGKTCRVCASCYELVTGKKKVAKKPILSGSSTSNLFGARKRTPNKATSKDDESPSRTSPLRPPAGQKPPALPSEPAPSLNSDDDDYTSGSDFYDSDDDDWIQPSRPPPDPPV